MHASLLHLAVPLSPSSLRALTCHYSRRCLSHFLPLLPSLWPPSLLEWNLRVSGVSACGSKPESQLILKKANARKTSHKLNHVLSLVFTAGSFFRISFGLTAMCSAQVSLSLNYLVPFLWFGYLLFPQPWKVLLLLSRWFVSLSLISSEDQ